MQCVVDSVVVNYKDEGKGPVMLIVHGWLDSLGSFEKLTALLSNKWRVIRLDLPNFGNSAAAPKITDLDTYTKFLADFLKKLSIDELDTLVGHSMGGQMAIYGVATDRLRPKRLVLLASAGVRTDRKVYKQTLRAGSKLVRRAVPSSVKKTFYKKIGSDYGPDVSDTHKQILTHVLERDVQAEAAKITIPTLLVYGADDTSTPPTQGQRLHQQIKGSILKILENAGHLLPSEQPAKIAPLIKEFAR